MELPNLSGRVAVITGASRGLGAGMAGELARLGLRLGLCSRTPPALTAGKDIVAECVDVGDEAAVAAFADRVVAALGPIDLWINNAAVLEPIAFLRDLESEQLRDHLAINVLGVFHGTKAYVHHLRARGGDGVLINISSGAAQAGYASWTAYCAGKAAVDRLTECVQLEEEAAGLSAYSVGPGVIDTDMQRTIRALSEEQFPRVAKFRQFKRDEAFNSPEFVARQLLAIAFDPGRRPDRVVVRLPSEE